MWDASLYAISNVLLQLCNKKAALDYSKAEYSQAGRYIQKAAM